MRRSEATPFIEAAKNLLSKIETYEQSGTEPIRLEDLQTVALAVQRMVDEAEKGNLPRRESRTRALTRMVVDQWPLGHSLGKAISELEENYINL